MIESKNIINELPYTFPSFGYLFASSMDTSNNGLNRLLLQILDSNNKALFGMEIRYAFPECVYIRKGLKIKIYVNECVSGTASIIYYKF